MAEAFRGSLGTTVDKFQAKEGEEIVIYKLLTVISNVFFGTSFVRNRTD